MKIVLDLKKTPEQNAAEYYEKAKKAKKKLQGAHKAIEATKIKLQTLITKKQSDEQQKKSVLKKEKKWYEKFRWFTSSEGFLIVGGRDATSNEILIKKHTEPADEVFHTDMSGSPFFVIKTEGKLPGEITLHETAVATASFSRAWKMGLSVLEVFNVKPEQVSKKTKAGEYMGKGSFMIYGKKNLMNAEIKLAIGTNNGQVMCGPQTAIEKNCSKHCRIIQAREKTSDTAKKIKRIIGGELDDIIAALPSGGCKAVTDGQRN